MTELDLISFENEIVELFEQKKIRGPIHLSEGNESVLIDIFKHISKSDWVFSSWRNHYHALLHGVCRDDLKQQIMDSYSMSVCSSQPKFMVSSIVGGTVSIATGLAYSLQQCGSSERVWCFIGDMTLKLVSITKVSSLLVIISCLLLLLLKIILKVWDHQQREHGVLLIVTNLRVLIV